MNIWTKTDTKKIWEKYEQGNVFTEEQTVWLKKIVETSKIKCLKKAAVGSKKNPYNTSEETTISDSDIYQFLKSQSQGNDEFFTFTPIFMKHDNEILKLSHITQIHPAFNEIRKQLKLQLFNNIVLSKEVMQKKLKLIVIIRTRRKI